MTGNVSTTVTAHKRPTPADIDKRRVELLTQVGLHSQNLTSPASLDPSPPPTARHLRQRHRPRTSLHARGDPSHLESLCRPCRRIQQSAQRNQLEPDRPPLRRSGWCLGGESCYQRAPYRTHPHRHLSRISRFSRMRAHTRTGTYPAYPAFLACAHTPAQALIPHIPLFQHARAHPL
jgi:hypothetical protein